MAKKAGDLVLARKKWKRSLKIRRSILPPHDPTLGFTLNELMNVCISLAPHGIRILRDAFRRQADRAFILCSW